MFTSVITDDLLLKIITSDDLRYNFVVSKFRNITSIDGFLLIIFHDKPNFEHFHVIHNCNFTNSCRCSFLKNIVKTKRQKKNSKLICDIDDDYIRSLLSYFDEDAYRGTSAYKKHFTKVCCTCGNWICYWS